MLTVVTGPPCGGKTTYVREHAAPTDLVLDLDAIASAMGYPHEHVMWDDDHSAVHAARMARAHVIHSLLNGRLQCTAWVIDTNPNGAMRAQYQRAGAHTVTIDPGQRVCLERSADRTETTRARIAHWYGTRGAGSSPALGIFNA